MQELWFGQNYGTPPASAVRLLPNHWSLLCTINSWYKGRAWIDGTEQGSEVREQWYSACRGVP